MPPSAANGSKKEARVPGTVGVLRIFGIPVRLHFTFLLLLVYLIFIGIGQRQSGPQTALYVIAIFTSVALHELAHALVARQFGVRTSEIVMFPIGGVSRLEGAPKPRHELLVALAGPLLNLAIGIGLLAWQQNFVPLETLREPTDANLAERVALGNLIIGLFNLLPAYPMDGGRILRAAIALRRPPEVATQIAAGAGKILAISMGLFGLLSSNYFLLFIAMFVYLGAMQEGNAAKGKILTIGHSVKEAMITDFRTLPHGSTIRQAGELLLATSQHDFPVVLGSHVLGLLGRSALIRGLLQHGPDAYVTSLIDRAFTRLSPEMDLSQAFQKVSEAPGAALVMDNDDHLLGILTPENLSEFILLKQATAVAARNQAQ